MLIHTGNQSAARCAQPEALGNGVIHRLNFHPEPAAARLAELLELLDHRHDGRRGRGKANADRPAAGRENGGVDANHLTRHIEQRPAGIAFIDGGIGLEIIVIRPAFNIAVACRNNTGRHGATKTKRIAHRNHPVTDAHFFAVTKFNGFQRLFRLHAQHSHIHLGVCAHKLGLELGAIGQNNCDVISIGNHMIVGDDNARSINDETRAQ